MWRLLGDKVDRLGSQVLTLMMSVQIKRHLGRLTVSRTVTVVF